MKTNKLKELIDYLLNTYSEIESVHALFLRGSIARGTDDEYSDIDFYCLVTPESYVEILGEQFSGINSFKEE